jgi:homoserine/homoserine lactone efflux protein
MNIYIPFIIATILLLIVPGPSVSIIVANTVRYNLIAGLKTTIGTVTGSASMFVIYAFGFDNLNNELNFILVAIQ